MLCENSVSLIAVNRGGYLPLVLKTNLALCSSSYSGMIFLTSFEAPLFLFAICVMRNSTLKRDCNTEQVYATCTLISFCVQMVLKAWCLFKENAAFRPLCSTKAQYLWYGKSQAYFLDLFNGL